MDLTEQETLYKAINALKDKFSVIENHIILKEDIQYKNIDAVLQIMNIVFLCEIKNVVTTTNVSNIKKELETLYASKNQPVLLIAKYISPSVVDDLATNNISTLDCVGNCQIMYRKGDTNVFCLTNKGEKNTYKERNNSPFKAAGLKVIFYLLQDAQNVNKPYRDIQNATGVSLGAIKNTINALVEKNFILITNKKRTLKNKNVLFNLWTENYNEVLKPKLLLTRMAFRTQELRSKWASMNLPNGMYWGGECGANKIDAYHKPGAFEIYTEVPAAHLMKTGFVKQDENGEIKIYQKFWKDETDKHIAPPILIYTDLMGSGNSRCREMAERILEYELNDYK